MRLILIALALALHMVMTVSPLGQQSRSVKIIFALWTSIVPFALGVLL